MGSYNILEGDLRGLIIESQPISLDKKAWLGTARYLSASFVSDFTLNN